MSSAIRVSTAPGTWGVEPGEQAGQPPWGLVLDEVSAAGFDGIELGPYGYLPTDPTRLGSELTSRDLELAGGYVMEPLHDAGETDRILDAATQTCSLLAAGGARVVVLIGALAQARSAAAGREDFAPPLAGSERATFLRTLSELVAIAEREGLSAVLHPHAGTHVEFEHEIEEVLEEVDGPLGLCVDTGHCLYSGVDATALVKRHPGLVRHVHLKDLHEPILRKALNSELSFEQAVAAGTFCPLGQGDVDLRGFLRCLRGLDYRGWATFEQDRLPTQYREARAAAEQSLDHLRGLGLSSQSEPS